MIRSQPTDDASQAGFVLTEVLVALALTALLAVLLLPFAAQLIGHAPHGERQIQIADNWMRMTARLTSDIAEAVPLPGMSGQSALIFRLRSDSVLLVRPSRRSGESGGLQLMAYAIEPARAGDALIAYHAAFARDLADAEPSRLGNATAVFSGPYRLSFVAHDSDGTSVDSWNGRKELPDVIELVATPLEVAVPAIRPIVLPIMARIAESAKPNTAAPAQP